MLLGRDKTKEDVYLCATLLNMFSRGAIRKDHPLQRQADQWTKEIRGSFISTVIKNEDFDSIKICEQIINGSKFILWLIDGLQRLTTIEEYKNNLFSLPKSIKFPLVYYLGANGDIIEYDLRGKYYSDLPEELKERFNNCPVKVVKHLDCTEEEIGYHIERYNNSARMNVNQKNITYMSNVAKYIKQLSNEHKFFKDCGYYTETERKNGVIDRVVAESVMVIFHRNDWKKGKTMSVYLNDNSTEDEFNKFKQDLDRLTQIIARNTTGKLFNSKNSFIWFGLFHEFTKLNLDDSKFVDFLLKFQDILHNKTFDQYDNESFDTYDKNKNTKDKKVINTKLDMLSSLMQDYLEKDIKNREYIKEDICEPTEIDLVQNITGISTDKESIELFNDMLDDYTVEVDNSSKLLEKENRLSLLSLIAYSFEKEIELKDWFIDYFGKNNTYIKDQKENYLLMKTNVDSFCNIET